jgi:hypothetical protein
MASIADKLQEMEYAFLRDLENHPQAGYFLIATNAQKIVSRLLVGRTVAHLRYSVGFLRQAISASESLTVRLRRHPIRIKSWDFSPEKRLVVADFMGELTHEVLSKQHPLRLEISTSDPKIFMRRVSHKDLNWFNDGVAHSFVGGRLAREIQHNWGENRSDQLLYMGVSKKNSLRFQSRTAATELPLELFPVRSMTLERGLEDVFKHTFFGRFDR